MPGGATVGAHAADGAVIEVVPQLLLQSASQLPEAVAGAAIGLQQGEGGKVADQAVHLGMARLAIEQSEVESEARALAIGCQHFGVGRQEHR